MWWTDRYSGWMDGLMNRWMKTSHVHWKIGMSMDHPMEVKLRK